MSATEMELTRDLFIVAEGHQAAKWVIMEMGVLGSLECSPPFL